MIAHMHVFAVYVKVGLPFALEYTLCSYLCFQQALLYSVSYLFFLYGSPSLYFCIIFYTILSNINGDFSLINSFDSILIFGGLKVHNKDWLTYSLGINRKIEKKGKAI